MKHRIILASLVCLLLCPFFAQAQERTRKAEMEKWRDQVKAEKIAFITSFAELNSEEAVVFWPIYNEWESSKNQAARKEHHALRALTKAIEENNEAKIAECTQNYLLARDENKSSAVAEYEAYCKVIPATKASKVMVAEEKFRHRQIGRIHQERRGPQQRPQK